jgi:hypothetical protein
MPCGTGRRSEVIIPGRSEAAHQDHMRIVEAVEEGGGGGLVEGEAGEILDSEVTEVPVPDLAACVRRVGQSRVRPQ